jgi:5'-methylthioadenosine phosphorylase
MTCRRPLARAAGDTRIETLMKLGIIGGSGLYNLPGLHITSREIVPTPFGMPSDAITVGSLGANELLFLPRHGSGHRHNPSELPYRANIYALKQLGVTHLLSINAVGSLKESLPPLTLVVPDQIIDRTVGRERTFFDQGIVAHVGIADPFCGSFSATLANAASAAGHAVVSGGTYVCIEGPQFSTKAESRLYRSWDASVIGMTAMPEARLAREAELCYASLAMVTDFDVWHEEEEPVTVEVVQERLRTNSQSAREIISALAAYPLPDRTCSCDLALAGAIVSDPQQITQEQKLRLHAIAGRYLNGPTA